MRFANVDTPVTDAQNTRSASGTAAIQVWNRRWNRPTGRRYTVSSTPTAMITVESSSAVLKPAHSLTVLGSASV